MYCPKCGTQNPDDARICRSCSTALPSLAPAPGQVVTTATAKTSGLAIASLVLAILSPCTAMLSAIPAIILGIVALVKISKSAGQIRGTGLAVTGIVLPAALLPVVAMTLGILMPALARTRQIAFRMVCATNMSGLGKAMLIYASDYDEKYPTPSRWCDLLIECCEVSEKSFLCKAVHKGPCNYAMNKNIEKLGTNAPPDMVLLFETHPGWNQNGGPELLTTNNHQGDGCNILYVDTHVEFVRPGRLKDLKWTAEPDSRAGP